MDAIVTITIAITFTITFTITVIMIGLEAIDALFVCGLLGSQTSGKISVLGITIHAKKL